MKNTNKAVNPIKPELIKTVNAIAKDDMAYMETVGELLNCSISTGNRKIGKCLNFSTMPGMSCGNCADCITTCYAMRSATYYHTCIHAWTKNLYMVRNHIEDVRSQLNKKMYRRRSEKYLRLHVAGELESMDELHMFVTLAWEHPEYQCWTYTKMYNIVNEYMNTHSLPENCHIMFSAWGTKMIKCIKNPHNLPFFLTVLEGEDIPEGWDACPGKCDECKAEHSHDGKCHGCIAGHNTYALHHY